MAETNYIADILVVLTAAIVAVLLFQRLGLGTVLGFLVAGALVGPWGLGFITAVDEIRHLAEFGVVFLLFVIGIELKPSRLWVMRRSVFGLGTAQVLATGSVITLAALALGVPTRAALVTGFGLALSSTAFGLQILHDKGAFGTAYGRSSFAILLLQDLAIVPLIALLPLLARPELTITEDVELAGLEAVLILVGVFVLGRILLRPILQLVARSRRNPKIFTATRIVLMLGTAWLEHVPFRGARIDGGRDAPSAQPPVSPGKGEPAGGNRPARCRPGSGLGRRRHRGALGNRRSGPGERRRGHRQKLGLLRTRRETTRLRHAGRRGRSVARWTQIFAGRPRLLRPTIHAPSSRLCPGPSPPDRA